jgi:phosphotransferase system enzyme I (PtsI)
MTFSVHGLAVSRGIAIGRAVLVASSRADVAHYFIDAAKTVEEITRVRVSRNAVMDEILRLQQDLPKDAPHEITALLDVHLMLLQDEQLINGVRASSTTWKTHTCASARPIWSRWWNASCAT